MTAEPFFVAPQRAAKADKIVRVLRSFGATAGDVVAFDDDDRRNIEADAGVRRGSGKTWQLVVAMLSGSADPLALCPTCGIGDPLGEIGARKTHGHAGACVR